MQSWSNLAWAFLRCFPKRHNAPVIKFVLSIKKNECLNVLCLSRNSLLKIANEVCQLVIGSLLVSDFQNPRSCSWLLPWELMNRMLRWLREAVFPLPLRLMSRLFVLIGYRLLQGQGCKKKKKCVLQRGAGRGGILLFSDVPPDLTNLWIWSNIEEYDCLLSSGAAV